MDRVLHRITDAVLIQGIFLAATSGEGHPVNAAGFREVCNVSAARLESCNNITLKFERKPRVCLPWDAIPVRSVRSEEIPIVTTTDDALDAWVQRYLKLFHSSAVFAHSTIGSLVWRSVKHYDKRSTDALKVTFLNACYITCTESVSDEYTTIPPMGHLLNKDMESETFTQILALLFDEMVSIGQAGLPFSLPKTLKSVEYLDTLGLQPRRVQPPASFTASNVNTNRHLHEGRELLIFLGKENAQAAREVDLESV